MWKKWSWKTKILNREECQNCIPLRHQNVRQVATVLQAVQRAVTFMEVAGTRSYTQMAIQHTGCSMHIYNPMAVQRAAVQCAAILKWLFNAQLFNAQLFNAQLYSNGCSMRSCSTHSCSKRRLFNAQLYFNGCSTRNWVGCAPPSWNIKWIIVATLPIEWRKWDKSKLENWWQKWLKHFYSNSQRFQSIHENISYPFFIFLLSDLPDRNKAQEESILIRK